MKLLALAIALVIGSLALATPNGALSDASYLRKLSFQLRGQQPAQAEYDTLKQLKDAGERAEFFKQKINEYLATAEYQDHMAFRLSERFQVVTPAMSSANYQTLEESYKSDYVVTDSLTTLFRGLTAKNLSWDRLLTGKEYTLYTSPRDSQGNARDFEFFKFVTKVELPSDPDQYAYIMNKVTRQSVDVHFEENDPRVAGALTTPRFLNRYNTTNINRNRRRAAAVFRIFLCDPMSPSIPPAADKKAAVIDEAFGTAAATTETPAGHDQATEEQLDTIMKTAPENRHGSDKQCAACHYKLDPMGKTFQNIGIALNPVAAPGALIFKRVVGQDVNVNVAGVGALATEIVKQAEYMNCQVEWFWQQFIGKDVALSFNRRAELVKAFDDVGRRTNDFVRLLVTAPEFRERPARVDRVQYSQVAPLLQRCDSCHNGAEIVGPLSEGKIGRYDLMDARERLNRPENARGKMPRNWNTWNPDDLKLLKRWLDEGAVGSDEKPQLSAQDLGGN